MRKEIPPKHFMILMSIICFVNPGLAQVPSMGTDSTFDVATWNIQLFGFSGFGPADTVLQFNNVLEVFRGADIDLWAVQEMGDCPCLPERRDTSCFWTLVDSLDGYDGEVASVLGSEGFVRVGFIYNTSVVTPISVNHILIEDSIAFSYRPPLQLQADVMVGNKRERIFFITLHMQARDGQTEHSKRETASQRLREYIDENLSDEKVLVLGDWNDKLTTGITSGKPSPYAAWVADTTQFRFLTLPLELRGENSFLPIAGSFIDHLVVNTKMYGFYLKESTARFTEVLTAIPNYEYTTSDHLPVHASFGPMIPVSVRNSRVFPPQFGLHQNYPNPFNPTTTIEFSLPQSGFVTLKVYNILGEKVATLLEAHKPAGQHTVNFDASTLASGIYYYTLTAGDFKQSRKMLLMR